MDKQLLEKYFKGHCSQEEVAQVEDYLALQDTPVVDELLMDKWEASQQNGKPKIHRLWYSVAAAVILGAIGVIAMLWHTGHPNPLMAMKWDTLMNNGNKIQLFTMPDGSEVWLNAHTAVAYNHQYNQADRELWLNGEGYFKVVADDQRPFKVHAGQLTSTVLGTEFNISTSNKDDGSIQISLIQGKIAVSIKDTFTKVLSPGQMLQYTNGQTPVLQPFSQQEVLDWKSGKIYFENTTLADALTKLQQRYGCSITLADKSLAGKKVSGEFKMDMSLDKILATLAYVHNLNFVLVSDHTYRVTKKQ
ncbi:FecR family protein [Chitinophaga niastensis]|uniref:FecR family protein n=1 Tax=Chitinophaga niastensis TaxID=536980 RepID=A0A2P8HU60_CHINA|nr:FecR domain-containing protein [Chitinophaga niastensis]PSL49725.1 FecR family protein [Chitinophaga niastensis]